MFYQSQSKNLYSLSVRRSFTQSLSTLRDDSRKKSGKEMRGTRGPAARVDNDYRVGALVVTRRHRGRKAQAGGFGKGGGGAIGRTQGTGGKVPCGRHGARARREENRMARGGMRGRRWAFRGPAMITDSASP